MLITVNYRVNRRKIVHEVQYQWHPVTSLEKVHSKMCTSPEKSMALQSPPAVLPQHLGTDPTAEDVWWRQWRGEDGENELKWIKFN